MSRRASPAVRIGVVVPARDEADLLPGCLAAIATAADAVRHRARVRVLVVLDGCTDASADRARAAGAETRVTAGGVGVARGAGCAALLTGPDAVDWLAGTDADSRVPPGWLAAHLDARAAGHDALVGTVRVDAWEDRAPGARARYATTYLPGAGAAHHHVHGANLGVATRAYRRVGGFPALSCGEDVGLVEALERAGAAILRTRDVPVRTSARRRARAVGGFADHLGALEAAVSA